jgi:PKD domain
LRKALRSPTPRVACVVLALCGLAATVVLAVGAPPAAAVVAALNGRGYGITPIRGVDEAGLIAKFESERPAWTSAHPLARRRDVGPLGGTQLVNAEDGPVMHSVTTHVIYWDPNGGFTSATKGIVDGFFSDLAHDSGRATNVFAIAGQYTDSSGNAAYSATAGAPTIDSEKYPETEECEAPTGPEADPGPPYTECLLDEQIQAELSRFIAAERLPVGPTQMYFILVPHKVVTCFDELAEINGEVEQVCSSNFFCAYHSHIEGGTSNEIIYADIPFSLLDTGHAKLCQDDGHPLIQQPNPDNGAGEDGETRFADVALKYLSHEYLEAATDPLVDEETAWVDARGREIGDKCNGVDGAEAGIEMDPDAFLPVLGGLAAHGTLFDQAINTGHYYLQSEWDNAAKACRMQPLSLGAGSFVAPSGTAGVPASFTASATDPYAALEPTWSFGDGAGATGVSVTHTYAAAGEYLATMTPKDRLTNATGAVVSHTIVVGAAPVAAPVAAVAPPKAVTAVTAHSTFATATAVVNRKTGVVTLTTSVLDPGRLSFRATFANGRFGAFASSACRRPRIELARRCLPATIVYASGSKAFASAGRVRVRLMPTASALKALRRALRRHRGLPLTLVLTFQSAHGGAAFSRSQSLIVRPRR